MLQKKKNDGVIPQGEKLVGWGSYDFDLGIKIIKASYEL